MNTTTGTRTPRRLVAVVVAALMVAVAAPAQARKPVVGDASTTAADSVRAPQAWADGHTGEGIGIALVDTGVTPRPDLHEGVVGQVDTSGVGRRTDGHGHGTFLAGLMVGDDGPDGALGVAPDAHVIDFKVADAQGRTSLDRVLAALGSVEAMADELGIRVVVLALGGPTDDLPDPIEVALEQLWASGLVVVVASGNDGDQLTEPGTSPYLLTVGATDDGATADRSDDTVAPWSGHGVGRDGRAKPDVHAPGTSVVSARVPGSLADIEHGDSRIGGKWFRGSGTSMAAAVAAGAASLVLDADPSLTPDEVKGRLVASAEATSDNPAGTIDVPAAVAAEGAVANTHLPEIEPVTAPAPDADAGTSLPISVTLSPDWEGVSWIDRDWDGVSWIADAWEGVSWIGVSWIGVSWIDHEWEGVSWIGVSWISDAWEGVSWISDRWEGVSWIDREWEGVSWISDHWLGTSWLGTSWLGTSWLSHS